MTGDSGTEPVDAAGNTDRPQRATQAVGSDSVPTPKRRFHDESSQFQPTEDHAQEPLKQSQSRRPVLSQLRTRSLDSLDSQRQPDSPRGSASESPSRWNALARLAQELQSYYRLPSNPERASTRSEPSSLALGSPNIRNKSSSSSSAQRVDQYASEVGFSNSIINVDRHGNRLVDKRLLRVLLEDFPGLGRSKRQPKLTITDNDRPAARAYTWPSALRLPSALNPIWLDPKMRETLQDRLVILHTVQRRPTVSVGSSTSDAALALKQGMRPVYSHSDAQAQLKSSSPPTSDNSTQTGKVKESSSSEPWPDFYNSVNTQVSAEEHSVNTSQPDKVGESTKATGRNRRAESFSAGPNDSFGRSRHYKGRSNLPGLDSVLIKTDYHEEFGISQWGASMRHMMAGFEPIDEEKVLEDAPAVRIAEEPQVAATDPVSPVEWHMKAKRRRVEEQCQATVSQLDQVNRSRCATPEAHSRPTGDPITGEQALANIPIFKSHQANATTPVLDTSGLGNDDGRRVSDSVSPKSCSKPVGSTSSHQHQVAQDPSNGWRAVVPPVSGHEVPVQDHGQKARDSALDNKAVSKAVAREFVGEEGGPETCVSSKTGPLKFRIAKGRLPSCERSSPPQ